jgi:hypothetical protein
MSGEVFSNFDRRCRLGDLGRHLIVDFRSFANLTVLPMEG